MLVDKRFFTDLMSDKRISLRSLARQMEMLPSQLSLTLSGKRQLKITEAVKLSQMLGAPLAEVMVRAGIQEAKTQRRRCRVIGHLNGNCEVIPLEEDIAERVVMPDGLPDDAVAIQARTQDTPISWIDGWVFFVAAEQQDANELIGHFCRVTMDNGTETIGTVRRGYDSGMFSITCGSNTRNERVKWVSKILITAH